LIGTNLASILIQEYSTLYQEITVMSGIEATAWGNETREKGGVLRGAQGGPFRTRRRHPARLRKLVEALAAYRPIRIYLFGSWASGEPDELSDIDLVIIKRTTKTIRLTGCVTLSNFSPQIQERLMSWSIRRRSLPA
jgi:predicted nucleotidyltransferase